MPVLGDHDEPLDLAEVERRVTDAIRTGSADGLRLLGHGEVSIVLGWPTDDSTIALKRVQPFRTPALAAGYVAACDAFAERLSSRGIAMVPTTIRTIVRDDGRPVVYHCQPVLDPADIGSNVLRSTEPAADHPFIRAVIDATSKVVDERFGFDCQAANWHWDGTTASQLDVTSPFILDANCQDLTYDSATFLQEFPAIVRPLLKRELSKVILRFTSVEGALTDFACNLYKEGLDAWVDATVTTARHQLAIKVDPVTARAMFEADRKLFPVALRLKRTQRWWVQHTGRRYDSLLPTHTTYGR